MEQLTELVQLVGKTVVLAGSYEDVLLLKFSDDSFIAFEIKQYFEGDADLEVVTTAFSLEPNDDNLEELKNLGILAVQRYEILAQQRDKRRVEQYETQERETLAKLQKKYGTK